jgi:hypothetical protein
VQVELEAVIAAPISVAAAGVIAWWHPVWNDVGDTPARSQPDSSARRERARQVKEHYEEH